MTQKRTKSPLNQAIVWLFAAIIFFSLMGVVIKHLGEIYPVQQLTFFRNLFGFVPSLMLLYFSTAWHEMGKPILIRQWKLGLLRGLFIAGAQFCFFLSLIFMEFATAKTLSFAGPLFVALLSTPVLRQKVGLIRWLAVFIGFAGIVLVMRPEGDVFSWYGLLPVCAAFCYASNSVSAPLFDESIPTPVLNLYTLTGALIGSAVLVASSGGFVDVVSITDWFWLAAMGLFGGVGVFFWVSAYRMTEPSNLAPFEYFGIPISFVMGWLFFAEAPFSRLIPGMFLIIGGGFLIIWRERTRKSY